MAKPTTLRRRLANAATMALVAGMSFLLLVYVGFGEANRAYEQFYVGKLTAQAKVLVNAIEGFLKRDLPLDQYVGFRPRAERLLSSDGTVDAIAVFDTDGQTIFRSGGPGVGLIATSHAGLSGETNDNIEVRRDQAHLQVILPLENEREIVGGIAISMSHAQISEQIEARFLPIIPIVAALSIGFAIFIGTFGSWLGRQRWPILQLVYAGLFLLIAALVVGNLISLYTKGTQIKTKALADSLAQRMIEVVGFNLDIAQIPGLDRAFSEYRRLNPEIAAAALVVDGEILIHTDSYMVGRPWESARGHYEYLVDISPSGSQQQVNIAVILPQEIVYWQTVRSVKNFAALFVASAFLASLFLQLAGSVNQRDGPHRDKRPTGTPGDEERALKLVKPVFYVIMCVEHLSYAFLASYIDGVVDASGFASGLTSTVFTVYYLCFALALVPAGHLAQQFSPKPLMIFGLSLTALSFLLLSNGDIGLLVLARAAAGVGQAMLFIGVQSYILSVAAPGRKTQGAAIIVYGFQGGMISGMAIGSLLVSYIGPSGVFLVGAVATIFTLIYAVAIVPAITHSRSCDPQGLKESVVTLGTHVVHAVRDRHLLQAIALVGIPAKAVLTGIVVFAIPLLMARQGYRQEDIGQLLMLYAAGVVLVNELSARWVDRTGGTRAVLVGGALLSGAGLGLIGLLGWSWFDEIPYGAVVEILFVVTGIVLLGAAHGFINAPIVSHVAGLELGQRIGVSALTATYRFLERIGHVAGPLVVGQMFLFAGEQAIVLAWSGLAIVVLGVLFYWLNSEAKPTTIMRSTTMANGADHIDDIVGLHLDDHHQAIVLTLSEAKSANNVDPAQSLMMRHLDGNGNILDPNALTDLLTQSADASSDVSTVVARRRCALRFKQFLADIASAVAPDQACLVITCSKQLRYCASDLVSWLDNRPGSRLVMLSDAEVWLDQMRGWLVLTSLDARLGIGREGAEELIAVLKDHVDSSGTIDLAWTGSPAAKTPGQGHENESNVGSRAVLHAVNE